MASSIKNFVNANRAMLLGYASLVGGSAGRLVISLAYFVAVANTLSLGDFGLFATASATGVLLSRLLAFGFVSPLYRIATVKRRLVGTYTLGLIAGIALSLPLVIAAAAIAFLLLFEGEMTVLAFVFLMIAEILFWRGLEIVIIVLNGLNRFSRGAMLLIFGTSLRAIAALAFAFSGMSDLQTWAAFYLGANAVGLAIAVFVFFPKVRLRWRPWLYVRRWVDAVSVASAEVLFYLQSELDKILVLAIGGPETSGIYAILMRLIDLTALPVRAALTILVQKLMRTPEIVARWSRRFAIEGAVVIVSVGAMTAMAVFLFIFPTALGENVAEATPYLFAVLAVPAFRNLIEYHSDLLYATGHTIVRVFNLIALALLKAGLLAGLLSLYPEPATWVPMLGAVFIALYGVSGCVAYWALRHTRLSLFNADSA